MLRSVQIGADGERSPVLVAPPPAAAVVPAAGGWHPQAAQRCGTWGSSAASLAKICAQRISQD